MTNEIEHAYHFTFGMKYRHEVHPVVGTVNPDGYVTVMAASEHEARATMFKHYGLAWAFCYVGTPPEARFVPAGQLRVLNRDSPISGPHDRAARDAMLP